MCWQFFANWQKLKEYDFSFDYLYLILSVLFLALALAGLSWVWNKILKYIKNENNLSNLDALRIYLYSEFGKYLPGKIWTILGRIYLGAKKGISKKDLAVSSFLDVALSTGAGLVLGTFFLLIFLGNFFSYLYFLSVLVALAGLIAAHPRAFYPVFNFVFRRLKKVEILPSEFLSYTKILKAFFCYLLISFVSGTAFFFLVKSITSLSFFYFPAIIGVYNLAVNLGVVAIFAPSGLGIREGIMTLFLNIYFPVSVAILISLIARIWLTAVEIGLFLPLYFLSKYKS